MNAMYKAIQVTKPGEFATVMKPLVDPGPGQVRIRVEASGVCHSDAGTVEGSFPISWPRVPGHEVVGRIDALGSGVQGWAVGQRVECLWFPLILAKFGSSVHRCQRGMDVIQSACKRPSAL
jgi:propanol-preferring alcohol dehydrogenase